MRHGRAKAARKTLQFFARRANIKPPYHVLLDGTFLVALFKYKFPLRERLDKVLQHATFTLYTTKSCLEELTKLIEASSSNNNSSKQTLLRETIDWANRECQILEDNDIPDFDKETNRMLDTKYPELDQMLSAPGFDILKLALLPSSSSSSSTNSNNSSRKSFFVACQDETVLDVLRRAGSVPCIRLARGSVLLLENPSKSGLVQASHEEKKKWSGPVKDSKELELVDLVMEEKRNQRKMKAQQQQQQQQQSVHQQRKKRKAKEPNPLSCKKSKTTATNKEESSNKKRRRRKNKKEEN